MMNCLVRFFGDLQLNNLQCPTIITDAKSLVPFAYFSLLLLRLFAKGDRLDIWVKHSDRVIENKLAFYSENSDLALCY